MIWLMCILRVFIIIKSNTITTNYFTTFLQNVDVVNLLLVLYLDLSLISLFYLPKITHHINVKKFVK